MDRSLRLLLAVLLLGTLFGLSACSRTDTGDKGYVDGQGIVTRLKDSERRTPGPVAGTTLEGKKLSLKQYAGKVVVLNVWGSWCAPCRREAPQLTSAARELKGHDVVFVGVDTKDSSADNALAFQRRYQLPYSSLFDPSGRSLLAFHGTLNPSSIPSTVIIDKHGKVAASILGQVPSVRTLVDLVSDVEST